MAPAALRGNCVYLGVSYYVIITAAAAFPALCSSTAGAVPAGAVVLFSVVEVALTILLVLIRVREFLLAIAFCLPLLFFLLMLLFLLVALE